MQMSLFLFFVVVFIKVCSLRNIMVFIIFKMINTCLKICFKFKFSNIDRYSPHKPKILEVFENF